jgi:hypothetical protein
LIPGKILEPEKILIPEILLWKITRKNMESEIFLIPEKNLEPEKFLIPEL